MLQEKTFIWQLFRYVELTGVVLTVLLLPIDRFPYLHTMPLRLGLVSLILLVIATVVRLWGVFRDHDRKTIHRYVRIAAILLLPFLLFLFSTTYALDRSYALKATILFGAIVVRAFCFFVLLAENAQLRETVKKTIYVLTAVIVGFGLFQFFLDVLGLSTTITDLRGCCTSNATYIFPRVHSVAQEPLYFANFLLIPLWLLTFDFLSKSSARKNVYLRWLFIVTATIFIVTIARSAFFGLLLSSIVFLCFAQKPLKKLRSFFLYISKLWGAALLGALLLVMLSGAASLVIKKTPINGADAGIQGSVELFSSHAIDVTDDSAQTRYGSWPQAFKYFVEEPVNGFGANNSRLKLNNGQYKNGVSPDELQPFNNDVLGVLVDFGLLGILAFLPLIYYIFMALRKSVQTHWKNLATPWVLILLAFLVQSNFFHLILLTRTWFVIAMVLVSFEVALPSSKKVRSKK